MEGWDQDGAPGTGIVAAGNGADAGAVSAEHRSGGEEDGAAPVVGVSAVPLNIMMRSRSGVPVPPGSLSSVRGVGDDAIATARPVTSM